MAQDIVINQSSRGMRVNLEQGSRFVIRMEGREDPLDGVLVGQEPHQYLIVRITADTGIDDRIRPGTRFQLSYVYLGDDYGFDSAVLGTIEKPYPLTFISYPERVRCSDPRQNKRVSCYIPATMVHSDRRVKGVVSDISRNGCRFVVKLPAALQTRQVRLINDLELLFPLMGVKGLVNFYGSVRNTTIDRERIAMGVEFQDLDLEIAGSIEEYIRSVGEINTVEFL